MAKHPFQNLVVTLLMCFSFLHTKAQNEYFVSIDQTSGSFAKINMLQGVNWIIPYNNAYDQKNHRYIFCGGSDALNWHLYTIDANTGDILDSPVFYNFADPHDNIYSLAYDDANDKLYGLHWSNSAQKEYFISVDQQTGVYTIIRAPLKTKVSNI